MGFAFVNNMKVKFIMLGWNIILYVMSSRGRMYRLIVGHPLPADGQIDGSAKHKDICGIAKRGKK